MDENKIDTKEVVQLARLALQGKKEDIELFVRRLANRYRTAMPELSVQLGTLIREAPSEKTSLLRRGSSEPASEMIPVDSDSRMLLARSEFPVCVPVEPIWAPEVSDKIQQIVSERKRKDDLRAAGLTPTRSAIFTGPPGVGKTLAARWIAQALEKPLVTLDLSAVMSSFLGKTGTNVRSVLDYARSVECVLLIDEFDAIAKRRDDAVEVGELKRLVTVLLQEIENWPANGLLLAATNHRELLDPAVWRRFDMIVEFPMPDAPGTGKIIQRLLDSSLEESMYLDIFTRLLKGLSYSEIEREVIRARRNAFVHGVDMKDTMKGLILDHARKLSKSDRLRLAEELVHSGFSQRQAHDWTGVSRDTIRKHSAEEKP